ncbi:hypothetical protein B0H19DRAFT_1082842 [Mycena capillaripes]|nr:hypothetical protein B0H19DRAFT_1082842 [Mycena capillaripes]
MCKKCKVCAGNPAVIWTKYNRYCSKGDCTEKPGTKTRMPKARLGWVNKNAIQNRNDSDAKRDRMEMEHAVTEIYWDEILVKKEGMKGKRRVAKFSVNIPRTESAVLSFYSRQPSADEPAGASRHNLADGKGHYAKSADKNVMHGQNRKIRLSKTLTLR